MKIYETTKKTRIEERTSQKDQRKRSGAGFTFVELMVVMAVIAILVLLAAPRFVGRTEEATQAKTGYNSKVLSDMAEVYHAEHETYPVLEGANPLPYGVLGVGGVDALYPLDMEKIKEGVTSLETEPNTYGIVLSGPREGRVYPAEKTATPNKRFGLLAANSLASFGLYNFSVPDSGPLVLSVTDAFYAGMYFQHGNQLSLKPNTSYVLSYSYQKIEGELESFGGHVGRGIAKQTHVVVDGHARPGNYQLGDSAYVANDTNVHRISVTFKTNETLDTSDTAENTAIWIQPNRGKYEPVTVLIDDLLLVEVVEP